MRPAPRIPRPSPARSATKAEAKRERTDAAHLAAIRKLPCCATGMQGAGIEAHHLCEGMQDEGRGMGRKVPDRWTIPLAPQVHAAAHRSGTPETYLLHTYGIDARALAEALWRESPDPEAMERQVVRARQQAALRRQA